MDGKPNGVVLAQVMFAPVGVLFVIGTLAWWVGIAVGALIALAGAAIIHSPVRTHQDDLIPELLRGLAVLVVAGIILTALLVPSTRRRVKT